MHKTAYLSGNEFESLNSDAAELIKTPTSSIKTAKLTTKKMKHITSTTILFAASCIAHAQSPYIHRIYDYMPAPGQFVNDMPVYAPGDTQADMNRKAEELIAGVHHDEGMITLGGYGGYVVFGFDHEVRNVAGKYDFRILANAFYADANPNGEASREGGSCEPGIVMVARDENGNGLPDDPWYELAGSDYRSPTTIRNYTITYHRPDENKVRVPHPSDHSLNDIEYIRWTTNGHGDGYLYRNIHHRQPYYPQWITDETLSFTGTKLADNYVDESGRGVYYVLYASHWGYADNQPNDDPRSCFNIEWAVDAGGHPVALSGIHFVKVYTAVNQYCGRLGETSTEIAGAEDLHLTGRDATVPVFANGVTLNRSSAELYEGATLTLTATVAPANASNKAVTWRSAAPDVASVSAGTVTAHHTGTATIQAIANDGYYIAECRITVRSAQVSPDPDPDPNPDPEPDPDPNPGTDPGPGTIRVTGVMLSQTQIEMQPDGMTLLTATVAPSDAANKGVQWSSSNPSVAEVTVNGLVMAGKQKGTATVTVATDDGGYRATCVVQVTTATANDDLPGRRSQVYYAGGVLHLVRLEGYDCTLVAAGGQRLATFRPASPDEQRPCHLAPGFYLLTAQKQGERKVFKIVTRNR
jgi:uncharacterized protein YjdB